MGTRSEIYIRNLGDGITVELWKHWDGYPDYMVPFFKDFAKWCAKMYKRQAHWLTYPGDVAAFLIAYDWRIHKEHQEEMGYDTTFAKPDVRPIAGIEDAEYLWILDLPGPTWPIVKPPIKWKLIGYRLVMFDLGPYGPQVREAIREGKDILKEFPQVIKKKVVEEEIIVIP